MAAPVTARSAAAQSICIEAERNGAVGSGATRAYAEPAAQAKPPPRMTAAPTGSMCALWPTSNATPNKPTVQPVPYTGVQFVGIPEFQDLGTRVSQQISAAIAGQKSVDAAMEQAQKYAEVVGKTYQEK